MTDLYRNSETILGADGRPARLRDSERLSELIGAYESYLALSFRLAPYNPDQLIGSQGYKIFDDMYTMACIAAPFDTIRNAVLYKGIQVQARVEPSAEVPAPEAQEMADALTFTLNEIEDEAGNAQDPREVAWEILYGIHSGFRVSELIWRFFKDGQYKGKMGLAQVAAKPNKQVGFDVDEKTLAVNSITSYTPLTGYQFGIPIEKVLRYTHQAKDALPYGSPMGRLVYRHYWTINTLMQWRNIAYQKFGVGFLLGKAPAASLKIAQQALDKAAQGASLVVPNNMDVDLYETNGQGLLAFESALESERQQCALAYLHNTLTTSVGEEGGNRALGNVHQDTEDYVLQARRKDIEQVFNRQLVRRWVIYNYGRDALRYAPTVSLGDWDNEDAQKWAGAVSSLISSGVLHPDEPQIRQKLKLAPMPPELKREQQEARRQEQERNNNATRNQSE